MNHYGADVIMSHPFMSGGCLELVCIPLAITDSMIDKDRSSPTHTLKKGPSRVDIIANLENQSLRFYSNETNYLSYPKP